MESLDNFIDAELSIAKTMRGFSKLFFVSLRNGPTSNPASNEINANLRKKRILFVEFPHGVLAL